MRTIRSFIVGVLSTFALVGVARGQVIAYEGMWFNDTFGSQGGVYFVGTQDGSDVSMYVDIDGNAFGGTDPDPITVVGTIDGTGDLVLSGSNPPLYDSISGTITAGGVITVDLAGAGGFFPLVEVRGTLTADDMNATYTIYTSGPGGLAVFAEGRMEATRVCLADIDGNGVLNLDDILLYADAFVSGGDAADMNKDGVLNLDDIITFAGSFTGGCP